MIKYAHCRNISCAKIGDETDKTTIKGRSVEILDDRAEFSKTVKLKDERFFTGHIINIFIFEFLFRNKRRESPGCLQFPCSCIESFV